MTIKKDGKSGNKNLTEQEFTDFIALEVEIEKTNSRRRMLAGLLAVFYVLSLLMVLIVYLFPQQLAVELSIIHSLSVAEGKALLLQKILKGSAVLVAITISMIFDRFFMIVLLLAFIIATLGIIDDLSARIAYSFSFFSPIPIAMLTVRLFITLTIGRMFYLVLNQNIAQPKQV